MQTIRHNLRPFLFLFFLTAANATGTGLASDTIGVQRTAVILLNTAGTTSTDLPSVPEINEAVFTGPYSANAFYKEVSFHQVELQGDIWGWYDRPDLREKCILSPEELLRSLDSSIPLNNYDRFVVLYNIDDVFCQSGGLGTSTHGKILLQTQRGSLQASVSSLAINHRLARPQLPFQKLSGLASSVLTHEIGHALGILGHANVLHCGSKTFSDNEKDCTQSAIADLFSVMGGEGFYRPSATMNACHRQDLGWFRDHDLYTTSVDKISATGTLVTLYPIAQRHSAGAIAVRIDLNEPIPVTTGVAIESLFLEYKTPTTFDRRLTDLRDRPYEIYKNLAPVGPTSRSDIDVDGLQIRGGFFKNGRCVTTYLFDTHPASLQWQTERYDLYDALDAFLRPGEFVEEPRNQLRIEVVRKNGDGALVVKLLNVI